MVRRMDRLFPWHYSGHARGLRKYWLSLTCAALNAANLALYVGVVAVVWRYAS